MTEKSDSESSLLGLLDPTSEASNAHRGHNRAEE